MTLDNDLNTDPPCHFQACAIQECLSKNSYQEAKCQQQVDSLYACCNEFYKRQGEGASTVSCPQASLLRLKLKQRGIDQ